MEIDFLKIDERKLNEAVDGVLPVPSSFLMVLRYIMVDINNGWLPRGILQSAIQARNEQHKRNPQRSLAKQTAEMLYQLKNLGIIQKTESFALTDEVLMFAQAVFLKQKNKATPNVDMRELFGGDNEQKSTA